MGDPWPVVPVLLVVVGIAVLALPDAWEGRVLVPVGDGHGLSFLDLAGAAPVTVGGVWLQWGLWARRERLVAWTRAAPVGTWGVLFMMGFGSGLLVASSFSFFWWWWAIGAGLLLVAWAVAVRGVVEPLGDGGDVVP